MTMPKDGDVDRRFRVQSAVALAVFGDQNTKDTASARDVVNGTMALYDEITRAGLDLSESRLARLKLLRLDLKDLLQQATHEASHFYVRAVLERTLPEIAAQIDELEAQLKRGS